MVSLSIHTFFVILCTITVRFVRRVGSIDFTTTSKGPSIYKRLEESRTENLTRKGFKTCLKTDMMPMIA